MELEFGKHFKDATNLLLMMDHDSGYVEGGESCTSTSNEAASLNGKEMGVTKQSENFLLNEDALLEKPELSFNWSTDLPYEIDLKEYEESRKLFFSPEYVNASVQSQNSSLIYSGLESDFSSDVSTEIPIQKPILVKNKAKCDKIFDEVIEDDILIISATESDMSLEEETFDPILLQSSTSYQAQRNNSNIISSLRNVGNFGESAIIKTLSFESVNESLTKNDHTSPKQATNRKETGKTTTPKHKPYYSHPSTSTDNWNVNNISRNETPSKKNQPVTNIFDKLKENRRLTLVFSKSEKDYAYSVKRKYPSLTPEKKSHEQVNSVKTPEKDTSKETYPEKITYPNMTPEKKIPRSIENSPNKKEHSALQTFSSMTSKKQIPIPSETYVNPKENKYSVAQKFPSLTPEKQFSNPLVINFSQKENNGLPVVVSKTPEKQTPKLVNPYISPDIFDDEITDTKTMSNYFQVQTQQDNLLSGTMQTKTQIEEKYASKLDQKLLKRTQKGMSGVLPPPSFTTIHLSAQEILLKWEENKSYYFWTKFEKTKESEKQDKSLNSSTDSNSFSKSLLLSVGVKEAKKAKWPQILDMRCHGLHHNCGKISEEIVDLCDKYQKRFVGAETQSTCTIFEKQNLSSPSKRKMTKPRWGGKSPGRRLSHLARRRITFSSSNLQAGGSSLAGSRARQILVDAKKIDLLNRRKSPRKTPKKTPKKTPSKSPKVKTRTPSSSAKKKLAMRFRKLTGEFETSLPSTTEMSSTQRALFKNPDKSSFSESSKSNNKSTKRALFQSPRRDSSSSLFASKSQNLSTSQEKSQLRRALFASPKKLSPLKMKKSPFKQFGMEKKRKRSESDDIPGAKFSRSMSMDIRPSTSTSDINKSLSRAQSDLNISLNRSQSQTELTEQQKKKLLWAVSGALQSQNVTNIHPQWKVFASVLARVTRRFFINQIQTRGSKLECGTSERMHRIARYHVISVIKGKTADEIINEYVKSRNKVQKPQGYIAPEEFNQSRKVQAPSSGKENVFQDRSNTMESWEKKKLEQTSKSLDNKIDRIRKVINFGDDR